MQIIETPRKCPHDDLRDCPLYVAGHNGSMPSCDDGQLIEGCAVDRGQRKYADLVAMIRWHHRDWWAAFVAAVKERTAREQREQNAR